MSGSRPITSTYLRTPVANALNSPAGYFLLLDSASWNETHCSTTSLASRFFSEFMGRIHLFFRFEMKRGDYIRTDVRYAQIVKTRLMTLMGHLSGKPTIRP